MAQYLSNFSRKAGEKARDVGIRARNKVLDRYVNPGFVTGMENFCSDIRYPLAPLAIWQGVTGPDNGMVAAGAYPYALAFSIAELGRSAGYVINEYKNGALTPVKVVGAVLRPASMFLIAHNAAEGFTSIKNALGATWGPVAGWVTGEACGTSHGPKKQTEKKVA